MWRRVSEEVGNMMVGLVGNGGAGEIRACGRRSEYWKLEEVKG